MERNAIDQIILDRMYGAENRERLVHQKPAPNRRIE